MKFKTVHDESHYLDALEILISQTSEEKVTKFKRKNVDISIEGYEKLSGFFHFDVYGNWTSMVQVIFHWNVM